MVDLEEFEELQDLDDIFELRQEFLVAMEDTHSGGTVALNDLIELEGGKKDGLSDCSKNLRHQLIHLKADQLDLSFVEKSVVSQSGVIDLCNLVVQGTAALREEGIFLDFDSLKSRALPVVGLYGSKQVLQQVFDRLGLLDEAAASQLETGIYGVLRGELLYIFYWHPGLRMADASRKDVNCNFIRYLVDLCDTVYVCLDAEDLKPLSTPSKLLSRRSVKRTTKVAIAPARQVQNSVSLLPGFHVHPAVLQGQASFTTLCAAHNASLPDLGFRISEGFVRCAVLNPVVCPPTNIQRAHEETVVLSELPKLVEEWFRTYNIDLTKLPDDDFKCLLQSAEMPVYEEYRSLKRTFELKTQDNKGLFYDLEKTLQQDFKRLQKIFNGILKAYRKFFYGTEESALSSSKEVSRAQGQPKTSGKPTQTESYSSDCVEVIERERELCKMWARSETLQGRPHSEPTLLFVGSEFCLVDRDQKPIQISEELGYMFVVETEKLSKSRNEPIQLEQKFVARSVSRQEAGPGSTIVLRVQAVKGDCPEGLIITCRLSQVSGWLPSPPNQEFSLQVYIKLKKPSSTGMLTWMQSYDKGSMGTQAKKKAGILVAASNIVKSASCGAPETGDWDVKYQDYRTSHSAKVENMLKRYLLPLLRTYRHFSIKSEGELLKQSFKDEESEFLQDLKLRIKKRNPELPTLSVTGCHPERTGNEVRTRVFSKESDSSDKRLILQLVSHEREQAHIIWKIAELAPMRNDVERAARNRTHIIVPHCAAAYSLIELDYTSERLTKVVTLKAGEVLLFVENIKDEYLRVYLSPQLGAEVTSASPIKEFPRRFDLVAFDETSKLVAFYAKDYTKVSIYKFDEFFRNMDRVNVEIQLAEYFQCQDLTVILFVPGKRELVLVDTENRIRIFQVSQGLMKPRSILIPGPPTKVCVSADGSCLLLVYWRQRGTFSCPHDVADDNIVAVALEENMTGDDSQTGILELRVYLLDDTMAHVKTLRIGSMEFADSAGVEAAVVGFHSQMHLLVFDTLRPECGILSKILEITAPSTGCRLRVEKEEAEPAEKPRTCPALDYIPLIFEKYATSPPLTERTRDITFNLILKGQEQAKKRCMDFVVSSIEKIERDKGKDFSALNISFAADTFEECFDTDSELVGSMDNRNVRPVGEWVQTLVCLLPIQIARAEKNGLRPLRDGLQLPSNINYADAVSLASIIRFGFYDSVLSQWAGPIKVISSMGKQSSGKSYLLNHLTGSLLDVAGGRCTDGVWMTVRPSASCMYVVLDFEGLGSFERTEQEDMLLSILNASVSNITIFNKKDFNLDKETEAVFQRFQNGVSLVKDDSRLFKGLFYLAIKDVDNDDVEELRYEFLQKIQQMCSKSEESFLTRMYGGNIEIAALPPFQKPDYYVSLREIQDTVEGLEQVRINGSSLVIDLKLVIAQISAKDWSPIDTQRAALKVDLLRKHLHTAICLGRLQGTEGESLLNFDTHEAVPDCPIYVDGRSCDVLDIDLELSPYYENQVLGNILEMVRLKFELFVRRTGEDDELWHSTFERFLLDLANRRAQRVREWLECNTSQFPKDVAVQTLLLKADAMLAGLQQALSLCSCKCQRCFLRCVLEKSHPSEHTCMGGHICSHICTYCSKEQAGEQNECTDASGHAGPHDCKTRSHTCGKRCSLFEKASYCNEVCALKPVHAGEHRCNTSQHICGQQCSLPSCKNPCTYNYDPVGHYRHVCRDQACPMICSMEDCNRKCASYNHFHSLESEWHLCGHEHPCAGVCEEPGACQIVTELSKRAKKFAGKRAQFEYEHASENKGIKKKCGIPIPPGRDTHEGTHSCHRDAEHYCEARCQACSYICSRPCGHSGEHDTTHGHMRDVNFVSEDEEIDLVDRKYVWGEPGDAELCMMHCKSQGRGHIHLIRCQADDPGGICAKDLYEGARHQTRKYGPDFGVPKDELTHTAYWRHLGFRDPCQEEDRRDFDLCNYYCTSEQHQGKNRSFCEEKLWHAPVPAPPQDSIASSSGYVTKDGHRFCCKHFRDKPNHIIFVIDRSGSMAKTDIKPTRTEFARGHNNRLGCVYEAIFRFVRSRINQKLSSTEEDKVSIILFSEPRTAKIIVNRRNIGKLLAHELMGHKTTFLGTYYSDGLLLAAEVMRDPKQPVIIFLSDGVNDDGSCPVDMIRKMRELDPRLVVHTILFGKDNVEENMLRDMAIAGNGAFQASIDEVQLTRSFEGLAKSLRTKVVGLMQSSSLTLSSYTM